MVGRYPGEDAFLGSREVGNCAQHRFSSCQGCSPSSSSPGDITCFEETIRTLSIRFGDFGIAELLLIIMRLLLEPTIQEEIIA
jgi:hypothetical protein